MTIGAEGAGAALGVATGAEGAGAVGTMLGDSADSGCGSVLTAGETGVGETDSAGAGVEDSGEGGVAVSSGVVTGGSSWLSSSD